MALDHHTVMDRLVSAQGPQRELDADVYEALGYPVKRFPVRNGHRRSRSWSYLDGNRWLAMASLTASLDDALALVDMILPGCGVSVDRNSSTTATIWRRDEDGNFVAGEIEYQVEAATMPLAVTLAALRSHFFAVTTKGAKV
ncbi:hypothetical protein [Shinella sp. M31]|uniref:hypothetical protein n=1 Tax=Shinella sp. M31 TaxID=3368615 RepID=UPI003BA24560